MLYIQQLSQMPSHSYYFRVRYLLISKTLKQLFLKVNYISFLNRALISEQLPDVVARNFFLTPDAVPCFELT